MRSLLTPPPAAPPIPEDQIPSTYQRYRWQVFTGIFIGYAAYYLLRKNIQLAGPYLTDFGFTKSDLGFAFSGVAISYGLSKFLMGTVSDRSNARNFLSIGLVITALLTILAGFFCSSAWIGDVKTTKSEHIATVQFVEEANSKENIAKVKILQLKTVTDANAGANLTKMEFVENESTKGMLANENVIEVRVLKPKKTQAESAAVNKTAAESDDADVKLADVKLAVVNINESKKSSILIIWFGIQLLIGWFGGCGWPPCGRVMTHWFSLKERGRTIAVWNVAHNVGGGLIAPITAFGVGIFGLLHWEYGVFYLPAVIAIGVAFIAWLLIRDTPQSCGLPSIEHFTNDFPPEYSEKNEQELSMYEIIFKYILNNRVLWLLGIANAFIYLLRYGIGDWAPTYLAEAKHYDIHESAWAYFLYEFAAIPGTLICGWLSDTRFKGRHAVTSIVFMALTLPFLLLYWLNPLDAKWLDFLSLIILGFLIYGPVMLIGVLALEIAPKKASGSSAGFMSVWGYFVGTAFFANYLMGLISDKFDWDGGFIFLCAGCVLSIIFLTIAAIAHRNYQIEK